MSAAAAPVAQRSLSIRDRAIAVGVLLLIASTLVQRPLFDLVAGSARFHVRAIDIAWVIFVASAVPLLAVAWRRRELQVKRELWLPVAFLAAYAAIAVVSLVWVRSTFGSEGFNDSVLRAARLVPLPVLALAVGTSSRATLRSAIVALVVVALLAAAYALWAWLFETKTVTIGTRTLTYGVTRAGGTFGNFYADGTPDHWWASPGAPNVLGFWLAVAAGLGLATLSGLWTWLGPARRPRLAGLVVVLVAAGGLLATHSRESWLAAVVVCAALLLAGRHLLDRPVRRALWIVVPAVLVASVVAVPSLNSRVRDTLTPGTFSYRSGPEARLDSWGDGVRWGWERFPIGWGVGGIAEHADRFGHSTAENVFLQAWAELGLIGFLALVGLCVEALRRAVTSMRHPLGDVVPATLVLLVFVAFVAHGLFGNTIGDPSVQVILGVTVGALGLLPPSRAAAVEAHL